MNYIVKNLAIFVILVIVSIFGFFVYISISMFPHDSISNDLKFNKKKWEQGNYRDRGRMINSLLNDVGIIGKSKDAITLVLGKPDSETDNLKNESNIKSSCTYIVDKGDAFIYDMNLYFDSTNHVTTILFDD